MEAEEFHAKLLPEGMGTIHGVGTALKRQAGRIKRVSVGLKLKKLLGKQLSS